MPSAYRPCPPLNPPLPFRIPHPAAIRPRTGVDVVFTSNRHPDGLYEHGLNRQLFLPFIAYLKEKCVLQSLGDGTHRTLLAAPLQRLLPLLTFAVRCDRADRDFRRTKEAALDAVYVVAAATAGAPASEADTQYAAHEALRNATRDLDAIFRREVGAADARDWETNKRLSLSSGKLLVAPRVRHRVRLGYDAPLMRKFADA